MLTVPLSVLDSLDKLGLHEDLSRWWRTTEHSVGLSEVCSATFKKYPVHLIGNGTDFESLL